MGFKKMKIIWLLILALLRPIYFIYSLCCLLIPFFILYGLVYFFYPDTIAPNLVTDLAIRILFALFILCAIVIPILVFSRKSAHDPNPFQSAFMSWFGTLRWYWNTVPGPMAKVGLPSGYLVENPMNYRLNAKDMRAILDKLQPGDILLRAYDGYLDGDFIRHSSVCSKNGYRPGWFTHAALFVGPLGDEDRIHVPKEFQQNKRFFQEGPQMVLHSMAIGVHAEDILTWFRCDYMVVLRVKSELKMTKIVELAKQPNKQRFGSDTASELIKNELLSGAPINSSDATQNAKLSALEKIGESYDFECAITDKFTRFSCAEFVYYCYRSIHDAIGLSPQLHAFYPLGKLNRHFSIMGRNTVTPDDFYTLAKENRLDVIWIDEISKRQA
jgi:hypothetical protein